MRCGSGGRHWWSIYKAPGAIRAFCGRCRAVHPDVVKALARGLYYANLYSPAEDSPDAAKDLQQQIRDRALLQRAIERVSNEEQA